MSSGYFFTRRPGFGGVRGGTLFGYETALHTGETAPHAPPVYLMVRKESADFMFLGRLAESRRIVQHLILRLPLGRQSIDSGKLDAVVAATSEQQWPLSDSSHHACVGMKQDHIHGYSSLPCFRSRIAIGHGSIPLWWLLLDLLFDLKHSDVFGRHRERLSGALRGSSVAAALMDKLEYLWSQERLTLPGVPDGSLSLALWQREQAWLDRCLAPNASKALRSGWFEDDPEDEVRRVIFSDRDRCVFEACERSKVDNSIPVGSSTATSEAPQVAEDDRSLRFDQVASWFLRRHDLDAFLLLLFRGHKREEALWRWGLESIVGAVGSIIIALIFVAGLSVFEPFQGRDGFTVMIGLSLVGALGVTFICWWFARWPRSAGRSLPARPVRFLIGLALAAVVLVYLLADLGWFEADVGARARRVPYLGLAGGAVSLAIGLGSALIIGGEELRRRTIGMFRLALPRMFLAIAAAWTLMMTTEEVVKANLLVGWTEIVLVCVPLTFLAWIFTSVEVQEHTRFSRRALGRAAWLVAVSFLISYGTGFFMTNLVMPRFLLLSGFVGSCEFEERARRYADRALLEDDGCESPQPVSGEGSLARLEELQWGAAGTWPTGSHRSGIRVLYTTDFPLVGTVYFFPGLHLYTAFFAMFVGLFFTLVLGGRVLTDPLKASKG